MTSIMSSENGITADAGETQENKTNALDVVQDAATDTVACDPSISLNEVPNNDINVNESLEEMPDVTGIV